MQLSHCTAVLHLVPSMQEPYRKWNVQQITSEYTESALLSLKNNLRLKKALRI